VDSKILRRTWYFMREFVRRIERFGPIRFLCSFAFVFPSPEVVAGSGLFEHLISLITFFLVVITSWLDQLGFVTQFVVSFSVWFLVLKFERFAL
jgi:hypothetical protein